MAGGVLMLSGMNVFLPINQLIPIHGVVQFFNNAMRSYLLRKHIRMAMCIPFTFGACVGAAAMVYLLLQLHPNQSLQLLLLLSLVGYTIFKPKHMPQLIIKDRNFIFVGILTGAFGVLAGAIDPLLGAFFYRDDLAKEEVVANKSVMQLVTHLTKIPAFITMGFAFEEHLPLIALLSIVAILSTSLGVFCLGKINRSFFKKLMWWALLFAFVHLIYKLIELNIS